MSMEKPNRLHLCHGETTMGGSFGALSSITPVHFPGNGHQPHLDLRFVGGFRVTVNPATFKQILLEGPSALAKLPGFPVIHDVAGGVE